MGLLVLVCTTVVTIPVTAFIDVAFAGDAVSACPTGGEIQKEKSLVCPLVAGFANFEECRLNLVECFLGDHRHMHSLVQFALVHKHAVVELAPEQIAE